MVPWKKSEIVGDIHNMRDEINSCARLGLPKLEAIRRLEGLVASGEADTTIAFQFTCGIVEWRGRWGSRTYQSGLVMPAAYRGSKSDQCATRLGGGRGNRKLRKCTSFNKATFV